MLSKLIHKYSLLSLILIISGCYLSKPEPGNNKSRDESAFEDYSAAVFLNEDKKFGDALDKINSAINKNDKIAKLFLLKAERLENSGKKIEALDAYKQVLKVQIYNPGVYEKMGELLASMGQYHSAIQNIKKAYAQKPRDTRLLVIAAKYYVMLKLYDRADSYLTTYESQTAPGDYTSDYYCIKAKVYFHDGKYDEVIDALDKCRTSKPLTTEYNKLYLNALLDSGKYDALYQYLAGLSPGVLTKDSSPRRWSD
ncbi:MAG: tetratricopeptide repeat protein, partial [Calditrichaceae bacterium]